MRPIYPAFGRELMRERRYGRHPAIDELVLVALGFWPVFGQKEPAWPPNRAIVVTDDMPLARLELRMLAGTNVLVAFDWNRIDRARDLALLILGVEPFAGRVYLLGYDVGLYAEVRKPDQWNDLTEDYAEYWPPLARDLRAMAERSHGNDQSAA